MRPSSYAPPQENPKPHQTSSWYSTTRSVVGRGEMRKRFVYTRQYYHYYYYRLYYMGFYRRGGRGPWGPGGFCIEFDRTSRPPPPQPKAPNFHPKCAPVFRLLPLSSTLKKYQYMYLNLLIPMRILCMIYAAAYTIYIC